MRNDPQRLADVIKSIDNIQRYAARGRKILETDELLQVWMVHHLQIIGEASAQLSKEFKKKHSDIPWQQIIGLRNIIVHEYFAIDLDEIWITLERDLPKLKDAIRKKLRNP